MRDIVCRGKTIDTDEWVEGYYVCLNGKEHRIYDGYAETDCEDHFPGWFTVDPKTIGQYTGLKDRNGKWIFEGDILRFYNDRTQKPFPTVGVVEYGKFNCNCYHGVYGWWFRGEDIREHQRYEIVGNRWDNPELLEVKPDE